MNAIVIEHYGNPGVFTEQSLPAPALTDTQVLVEMYATTASSADTLVRSGTFKQVMQVQFPHVLGVEVAGIVRETGRKVAHLKTGDRVMGLTRSGGGYADFVALEESSAVVIPPGISFQEAGALPASALSAWQSLFQYGKLLAGQRILIHAGAGGVGHLAVQLAKQHGAYVIATARAYNHDLVRQLGADEVIDYTTTDFSAAAGPVDVVLDMVRDRAVDAETGIGATEQKNIQILRDHGRLVSLVDPLIATHPKVRGIEAQFAYIEPNREDLSAIVRQVSENRLKVHVDKIFPFTIQGVTGAHAHYEAGKYRGKLVIQRQPG
ncbi:NADP-dependent oxidoreductase [Paenibacillus tritici]|uniref:NADP-dependent oxidoreductase n=1 Tax=Paenibacillus tritici TaxID=1873425 RepID=A0ABX2DX85_9BACL|nr:NADP-dependent oxidoreductase [Paenibacillus tritici]NQX48436.1 NADP-dependent oxidoreductase [Paenibacillus tritici]